MHTFQNLISFSPKSLLAMVNVILGLIYINHVRFCKCFTTFTQSELFILSSRANRNTIYRPSNFTDSHNFILFHFTFQFWPTCYFRIFSLICPTLISFLLRSLFRPWRSMSLWVWSSVRAPWSKTPICLRRLLTAAPTLSASRELHHVYNCLTSAGCFWILLFSFHNFSLRCTGEQYLDYLGIEYTAWGLWENHVALAVMTLIFFIIAYLKLRYIKKFT